MRKFLCHLNYKIIFYRVTLVICVAVFLFSSFMIGKHVMASIKRKHTYGSLQETFYEEEKIKEVTIPKESEVENKQDSKKTLPIFKELLEINTDTVGWIRISNTTIDYPVVKGEDNDFYLHNTVKREKNKAGSIFMDYRNSVEQLDQNTIIYGHHMKDGSMFKDLIKYKDNTFLTENPVISFNSIYEEMQWKIFAVYVTDTKFNYIKPNFTEKGFQDFLQTIEKKSLHTTGVTITSEDKILTLSTCAYDFNDARMVVQAKLINN